MDKRPERLCLRSGAAHITRISCAAALTLSDAIKMGAHSTSGSSSRSLAPLHGSNTPNGTGRSDPAWSKKKQILCFFRQARLFEAMADPRVQGPATCWYSSMTPACSSQNTRGICQ